MNYATFKAKRGDLHVRYHAAARAGDHGAARRIDAAITLLESEVCRDYQISERIQIRVYVQVVAICIGAKRIDRGVNLVQLPHYELECFNANELHILAELREAIQEYEDGKREALSPSGPWTRASSASICYQCPTCQTHRCAVHDAIPDWVECTGNRCPYGGMFVDAPENAPSCASCRESQE